VICAGRDLRVGEDAGAQTHVQRSTPTTTCTHGLGAQLRDETSTSAFSVAVRKSWKLITSVHAGGSTTAWDVGIT
jgi:hypothetical protein